MTGGNFLQTNKSVLQERRESRRRRRGEDEDVFSPAHDLVCQQHSAHLGVFVLAFINNRLRRETQREGRRWLIKGKC